MTQLKAFFETSPLARHILRIAEAIHAVGGRALLVGGCIRDALQGTRATDIDMELYGISQEKLLETLSPLYHLDTVGQSFGVTKIHGLDIDLALPRRETKLGLGHKGFDIQTVPDLSPEEASARRDFTINAIMYDPLEDAIIDPHHGQDDLSRGILRHVSEHFSEDPLRVLRGMQFAARFDFEVAPETIRLCQAITPEGLPRERLAYEWEKLFLKARRPSRGLNFLRDCHWVDYYPELKKLIGCEQTPIWHPEGDVWIHTLKALDETPHLRSGIPEDDIALGAAVLCHDLGKPATSKHLDDGRIICHNHDNAGVKPTQVFVRRLWNSDSREKLIVNLVKCHMRAFAVTHTPSDKAFRRLSVDVNRMDLLLKVLECDLKGSCSKDLSPITIFKEAMERLEISNHAPVPFVLGRHLLERGMKPGPQLGVILKNCFDAQIEGKFRDLAGGLEYLERHFFTKS